MTRLVKSKSMPGRTEAEKLDPSSTLDVKVPSR